MASPFKSNPNPFLEEYAQRVFNVITKGGMLEPRPLYRSMASAW
jgi:hypothetical protein